MVYNLFINIMGERLVITGSVQDVKATIDRISNQHPGLTVQEYLDKMQREEVVLC